jgi:hypothetical protein
MMQSIAVESVSRIFASLSALWRSLLRRLLVVSAMPMQIPQVELTFRFAPRSLRVGLPDRKSAAPSRLIVARCA